ncbi:MAG: ribonuclease D [Syntrophales bacterium]|jgi:ribonuclease D|nr:ribonuclease D [Syntrophales bacterium]
MENRWTFVDNPANLKIAEKKITAADIVAVDTEYDSFRYFFDKLCLLQVQTGAETWLIDQMAGLDMAFLGKVLDNPDVLKIFHAGDNDIRILKRDYSFSFRNIFDTHRAASLLGVRQLALSRLLESYLGVTLEKKMQRSRWDLRPLSIDQLNYAALDTVYLPPLYLKLKAELGEKGLEREAERVFAGVTEVVWRPRDIDQSGHRKLPGYRQLTPAQKERLRLLYSWRFDKAQKTDRACFMLLSDQQLVSLARVDEVSAAKIVGPGLLSSAGAQRFGSEIIDILIQ